MIKRYWITINSTIKNNYHFKVKKWHSVKNLEKSKVSQEQLFPNKHLSKVWLIQLSLLPCKVFLSILPLIYCTDTHQSPLLPILELKAYIEFGNITNSS